MYKYVLFIILPLVLVPFLAGAQTTSESLPQAFMLPMGTSTESVAHGQVTVDIGIQRRFSESPQALSDVDLSSDRVINTRRLQVFTRHLALTEPIKEMDVGSDEISVRMQGSGRLLGFIPIGITYDVDTAFSDGELDEVVVERTSGWWSRLASKQQPEEIAAGIETTVQSAEFLSMTQMRAVILEAIVDAISNS